VIAWVINQARYQLVERDGHRLRLISPDELHQWKDAAR
jgi:hypothetical protein